MRVRKLGMAALVALVLALAGCASSAPCGETGLPAQPAAPSAATPTPNIAPIATPTPDIASVGIPKTIGPWHLAATVQPIEPGDLTAAIIAVAGGDPATAVDVNVQVSGGTDKLAFDALRVPGVTLDAFTRVAELRTAALGITERKEITVAGVGPRPRRSVEGLRRGRRRAR